jgi:hypothetical protein
MKSIKPFIMVAIPEIILGIVLYLGFLFKILHLPFASIVLTLGLLTLGGIYMIFGFAIFSNANIRTIKNLMGNTYLILKLIFGFLAGFCMAVIAIGYWGLMLKLPVGGIATRMGIGLFVLLTLVSIGVGFKYKRFLLAYLRAFISLLMISIPMILFWFIFRQH